MSHSRRYLADTRSFHRRFHRSLGSHWQNSNLRCNYCRGPHWPERHRRRTSCWYSIVPGEIAHKRNFARPNQRTPHRNGECNKNRCQRSRWGSCSRFPSGCTDRHHRRWDNRRDRSGHFRYWNKRRFRRDHSQCMNRCTAHLQNSHRRCPKPYRNNRDPLRIRRRYRGCFRIQCSHWNYNNCHHRHCRNPWLPVHRFDPSRHDNR